MVVTEYPILPLGGRMLRPNSFRCLTISLTHTEVIKSNGTDVISYRKEKDELKETFQKYSIEVQCLFLLGWRVFKNQRPPFLNGFNCMVYLMENKPELLNAIYNDWLGNSFERFIRLMEKLIINLYLVDNVKGSLDDAAKLFDSIPTNKRKPPLFLSYYTSSIEELMKKDIDLVK